MKPTLHFAATHLTQHLTEEEFTDSLLGLATQQVEDHLASCPKCRTEADELKGSISSFTTASRLWAQNQPLVHPRGLRMRAFWYSARPVAGVMAAAIAILGVAIPVGRAHQADVPAELAMVHPPAVRLAAELATETLSQSKPASVEAPVHSVPHHAIVHEQGAVSESLAQDNALMAAVDAEIEQPVSASAESIFRSTVTRSVTP